MTMLTYAVKVSAPESPTSGDFELAKDDEEGDAQVKVQAQNDNSEQISAADYDPSLDRREDEQRRVRGVKDESIPEVETIEEEEEEEEDVEDMFAMLTSEKKTKKVKKVIVSTLHTVVTPLKLTRVMVLRSPRLLHLLQRP
jgi:serine/threonine-protein kinase PRP4